MLGLAGLVVGMTSLVLAGFAIWLSLTFYRLSSASMTRIDDASRDLAGAVERIDALFKSFYADTFSMMRDTYADMRKHAWRGEPGDVEQRQQALADEKMTELEKSVSEQIAQLMSRQMSNDRRIAELGTLVGSAVERSRKIEADSRTSTAEARILDFLQQSPGPVRAGDLTDHMQATADWPVRRTLDAIARLLDSGIIRSDKGDSDDLRPTSRLWLRAQELLNERKIGTPQLSPVREARLTSQRAPTRRTSEAPDNVREK